MSARKRNKTFTKDFNAAVPHGVSTLMNFVCGGLPHCSLWDSNPEPTD